MQKMITRVGLVSLVMVFAAFSLLAFFPTPADANPPKQVLAVYDSTTKTLTVTITHPSAFASHYIKKVEIKKNETVVTTQEYTSQPSATFTYSYPVEAADGDILEVKAMCSWFGSKSVKVTVGQ